MQRRPCKSVLSSPLWQYKSLQLVCALPLWLLCNLWPSTKYVPSCLPPVARSHCIFVKKANVRRICLHQSLKTFIFNSFTSRILLPTKFSVTVYWPKVSECSSWKKSIFSKLWCVHTLIQRKLKWLTLALVGQMGHYIKSIVKHRKNNFSWHEWMNRRGENGSEGGLHAWWSWSQLSLPALTLEQGSIWAELHTTQAPMHTTDVRVVITKRRKGHYRLIRIRNSLNYWMTRSWQKNLFSFPIAFKLACFVWQLILWDSRIPLKSDFSSINSAAVPAPCAVYSDHSIYSICLSWISSTWVIAIVLYIPRSCHESMLIITFQP